MRAPLSVLLFLLAMLAFANPAHAARSYDNCTGFITSLPATISTPGTWCLKQDLSTSVISGWAITIAANDVVLDCNDFLVDGLSAGIGTQESGIVAYNQTHVTVRHCNVRGFFEGLVFLGTTGGRHVIEDNHFIQETYLGISVRGDGSVVRRNLVTDTGGSTVNGDAYGIQVLAADADIIDNKVIGVVATTGAGNNDSAWGISVDSDPDGLIAGNAVKELVSSGSASSYGIFSGSSPRTIIRNNDVENGSPGSGYGISCDNDAGPNLTRVRKNVIVGFPTAVAINSCADAGDNDISP